MNNEQVTYFYPRNRQGKRFGHAIAAIVKDNKVFIGYSNLAPGDRFSRKIGRQIAESRAREQIAAFEARKKNV